MIRAWDRVRPGDIVRYLPYDANRVGTVLQVNDDGRSWMGSRYHGYTNSCRARKLLVRWSNPTGREWVSWVIDRNCELIESPMIRLKAHLLDEIAERVKPNAEDETDTPYIEVDMLRPDDDTRPLRAYDI